MNSNYERYTNDRAREYENGKQICRKKFSVVVEVIQIFETNFFVFEFVLNISLKVYFFK